MASDIVTRKLEVDAAGDAEPAGNASHPRLEAGSAASAPSRHVRRRGPLSPLTRRILAINALAPALLVVALLYLDQYQAGLVDATVDSLSTQGELIAGALAEGAVATPEDLLSLDTEAARQIVRRLIVTTDSRVRLFDDTGKLVADSRQLRAAGRAVVTRALPPPEQRSWLWGVAEVAYNWIFTLLPPDEDLPVYIERLNQTAQDYDEVELALGGDKAMEVRDFGEGMRIISVAVPVQGLRKVLGALLLTVDSREIDSRIRAERLGILEFFAGVLAITVMLSLFLAGTIARPIRRLALAAERVRRGQGRRNTIPDFTDREDEIGDLSGALREMTLSLYHRLDAIEAFAADVAHEIKNPLTSLRSAVETLARTSDPERQRRLMAIIEDDVQRLDRLISDISSASRLDAELSRAETRPIALDTMLQTVVDIYRQTAKPGMPEIALVLDGSNCIVSGIEQRLGQVVRNLLDNAISFSPSGGKVRLQAGRAGDLVRITVEDDGPGLPEDKLEAVFDRFYSERPAGEKYGSHSGLGLSISRQIVEAHDGSIRAANRHDPAGRVIGARFVVELPVE